VRGAGTLAGGLPLTCAAFTWAAGSWLQARLAPVSSRRVMVTAGLVLVLAGIGLVTPVPVASVPVGLAAVAWAIAGLGMGLAYSTTALVVIESAPPGSEGSAASAVQLANTLGIALGTGVAGAIVAYMATSGAGLAPGIAIADLVLLATCGVGILTATRIAEPAARGAPPPARLVTGEHGPGL
jgi:MFS family permease